MTASAPTTSAPQTSTRKEWAAACSRLCAEHNSPPYRDQLRDAIQAGDGVRLTALMRRVADCLEHHELPSGRGEIDSLCERWQFSVANARCVIAAEFGRYCAVADGILKR